MFYHKMSDGTYTIFRMVEESQYDIVRSGLTFEQLVSIAASMGIVIV